MHELYNASTMQKRVIDADQPVTEYLSLARDFWSGEPS